MLTLEENALLTQTGPETPMGELMRRYWMPALLAEELPAPDCTPIRVKLLGEDLLAFRDTQGRVGIIGELCLHRCASLAYARPENNVLTCIYHGWQYDVFGNVLATPPEPAESTFKNRLKLTAYSTREAGDVIWVYMGPPALEPFFPEWEWSLADADHRSVSKTFQDCNYSQALEGDIDSSHSDYLHSSEIRGRPTDHSPRLEAEDTEYGFRYAAIRKTDDPTGSTKYVRITLFAAPFSTFTPPLRFKKDGQQHDIASHRMYVPTDDEHHAFFSFSVSRTGTIDAGPKDGTRETGYFPAGNRGNMHLQNRVAMQAGNWTGIQGIRAQDRAVTESMGAIAPRHLEHLGTSDVAVMRMRRRMLDAVRDFTAGANPLGIDPAIRYGTLHADEQVVPVETPWQAVLDDPAAVQATPLPVSVAVSAR